MEGGKTMSIEHAREFIKRVKNEKDLWEQASSFQTREERRQWAQGLGYDFTGEEMEQASSELTDDELEQVAGGKCCGYTCESENQCGYDI
jgi:predicted ribosomally synthesized peptide with nif11-like leader